MLIAVGVFVLIIVCFIMLAITGTLTLATAVMSLAFLTNGLLSLRPLHICGHYTGCAAKRGGYEGFHYD